MLAAGFACAAALVGASNGKSAEPAIAMHGAPAYAAGFDHFAYVNPAAPKGGRLVEGILGTFDSLNPLIVKGVALQQIRGYVIESLMTRGYDEPFTLYGLLAKTIETDAARNVVTFTLDPAARFSDGTPVTPEDVIFSWDLLRQKGRPNHRGYYGKVARAEQIGEDGVRFDLAGADDRELPLILALMPVLPKHAVDPARFEETTFAPPVGSGPYLVAHVDPGKSVTLARNRDYWGEKLAVNRGLWNFDEVRFDFYRDANVHFDAFKRGLYDVREETDATRWKTGYDFPAARDGRVVAEALPNGQPKGMEGFVFNTRRPLFADIRVREALGLLFDFEWINRNYFFDLYRRTGSYFEGSELSARGRPADARERALLAAFANAVRPDVMAGTWAPPVSDGSGRDREMLKRALALLSAAGYELKGTELRERASGRPFAFEILVATRDRERLALAFARDLKRAGIAATVRLIDGIEYQQRIQAFDYDMMIHWWPQSLSPGNDESFYFGSAAADDPGSRNYMGAKNPAVDAMIAALLAATDRADFVAAVRALDRVLISGFYVVPLFHAPDQWIARWTRVERPAKTSLSGWLPETWWHRPPAE
ncbi:MAG TPA: extracellular solute-binding protein [Xanthobacteraceae bacterium]|nr:extracellular solute-binding protein [Xanthobacteraceae bacterium]